LYFETHFLKLDFLGASKTLLLCIGYERPKRIKRFLFETGVMLTVPYGSSATAQIHCSCRRARVFTLETFVQRHSSSNKPTEERFKQCSL